MKRLLLFLLWMSSWGYTTYAHESRPLFVEIIEQQSGVYLLQYKIPASIQAFNAPEVQMPSGFEPLTTTASYPTGQGILRSQKFKSEQPIYGNEILIKYPVVNPSVSSIIKVRLLDGTAFQSVLGPEQLSWKVPEEESFWGVAGQYTLLGIQHILEGWDHLLFLVCLILVAGTGKRLLITITGFTLAHSVTLALSALNIVRVPIPPVEATIALSVVFLATEIASKDKSSLTYQFPILVSSSFGLLHGFGFAAVLGEIGLPQKEILSSLLFFNIGVELGQVFFIAVTILIFYLLRKISLKITNDSEWKQYVVRLQTATIYLVGIIASYWAVERIAGFF